MYISADEFERIANVSSEIAERAGRLLDMAEVESDDQKAMALVERARDFMSFASRIYEVLDVAAQRDTPSGTGILDRMDPGLRRVIEQYSKAPS